MLSPDLWWSNAARVEIDHRAREARFRLEHLGGLLADAGARSARAAFYQRAARTKPIHEGGAHRPTVRSRGSYPDRGRIEVDHRARDARFRLEHLERLMILRVLP